MQNTVFGGLLGILRISRVAWYRGPDGITAYYEQPAPGVPGAVFVNGQRITRLTVDREGVYADFPCPQVQHMLVTRGVNLQSGWTCGQETYGVSIHEAAQQSQYSAVRHHNGRISVQWIDQQQAIIFVNGVQWWSVSITNMPRALAEMSLSPLNGWYPVQQDLIGLHRPTF